MSEHSPAPNSGKQTRKPLRFEDFQKLMTREQMEAFAAACRIKYGTAQAEDFEAVTQHLKKNLAARKA
ncbi:MAG TPA: hypothetical protein VM680_03765, partial [Verrucomicrobiae bacterium]|nr:hypothetical protein [Verrucomicrobiae bacterium]